jgi:putative addiction module component (TIGR02574 family)
MPDFGHFHGANAVNPCSNERSEKVPTDTKQVLETALALPAIDRAAIVESLLASLDHPDATLDECWAVEAEKSLAAYDAGQMKFIPADEVFKEFENLCLFASSRSHASNSPKNSSS